MRVKDSQKNIKENVDPKIYEIYYALAMKKTKPKFSYTHWCRAHNHFLNGKNLDGCDRLKIDAFSSTKPLDIVNFWI